MIETLTYECPVCGYAYLDELPEDHTICACCGTHFGYEDVTKTYRELRNLWLKSGGLWFDPEDPHRPLGSWDAWSQLDARGFPYDVEREAGVKA